jgi:hypothetical protein
MSHYQQRMKGDLQDYKEQRLLPQFYMRSFGSRLFCFDKMNNKVFPTDPRKIGYENNFYEANFTPWSEAENLLGDREKEFKGTLLESLENYRIKKLSHESHNTMCTFIAVQMLRTNLERIGIGNFTGQELDKIGEKYLGQEIMEKIRMMPLRETAIILYRLNLLGGLGRIADVLFEKEMFFVENTTQIPFWTSDNPVVPYNGTDKHLDLSFPSTEVFFPLSGNLTMVFSNSLVQPHGDEDFVSFVNLLQVMNSTRFVYSTTNDFELAKALLSKYAAHAKPAQHRIVVN